MKPRLLMATAVLWASGCLEPGLYNTRPVESTAARSEPQVASPKVVTSGDAAWLTEPVPASELYLLYLAGKGTSVPAGPYIRSVRLEAAAPAKAGWLVAWLTEPVGYGGGKDRQFLVYSDPLVWALGAEMGQLVDVGAAGGQAAGAWGKAIALLYASPETRLTDPSTLQGVLEALGPLCSEKAGSDSRKWAACMLAGRVLGHGLGRWREAAERFALAAEAGAARTEAWLVAAWAQAHALQEAGEKAEARAVAQRIVQRAAEKHKKACAYRRAEALLSERQ